MNEQRAAAGYADSVPAAAWLLDYANNVVGERMLRREDLTGA